MRSALVNRLYFTDVCGEWVSCLQFDVHRGILPADVVVDDSGMQAKLTRSKVSGPEKKVVFRIVVVDAGASVQHRDWLATRWKVLSEAAPYDQDYFIVPFTQ